MLMPGIWSVYCTYHVGLTFLGHFQIVRRFPESYLPRVVSVFLARRHNKGSWAELSITRAFTHRCYLLLCRSLPWMRTAFASDMSPSHDVCECVKCEYGNSKHNVVNPCQGRYYLWISLLVELQYRIHDEPKLRIVFLSWTCPSLYYLVST